VSLLELFRFLVPYFAAVPDVDVLAALALAEPHRPACLTPAQQDEAQVWYAASILLERQRQTEAGSGTGPIPYGIKSEKEGDLQRTYGFIEGVTDPIDFGDRYDALARLCGGLGAITVGFGRGPACCC
jgi:hypothetical protein